MPSRRKVTLALGALALSASIRAPAQTPARVWRIGLLDFASLKWNLESGRHAALIEGLRAHGYVENRNFVFEARYADGKLDRMDGFAEELVRQKVDVILSTGTPASHAAKRATSTIPIVITATIDPVGDGFAASLARPGGNLTGFSSAAENTVQKLVELTAAVVNKPKRVAVLTSTKNTTHPNLLALAQSAGRKLGIEAVPMAVSNSADIERAFEKLSHEPVQAVIVLLDGFLILQHEQIASLALKHRLPSSFQSVAQLGAGGLMGFGHDPTDNFRRTGALVDKIFKGARPGDIPFEQPNRYYFVINRKVANQLGLKLTNEVLSRADRTID